MTAASGEEVLVWQTIIGNGCIAATGGRFDAGESGNRGAVAWCSNGVGSRSGSSRAASAARRCDGSPTRIGCPQPHDRRSTCVCPFSASPERGWYRSPLAGKVRFSSRSPISPRAATDPIHEILDTPPRNVAYP
jgi:hypothetical protein